MPSTLIENLNSDLMKAFSALLPKKSPQQILVYVESDDDIAFWRNILNPYEKYGVRFDIQLPAKKGKQQALVKAKEMIELFTLTGSHLIICVDSDYDYLLQNPTVNSNDFVFQTYTYSIENYQCYSETLHVCCVQSTKNDKRIVDFEALMKLYSNITYPLFLWSVLFYKKGQSNLFSISEFCDKIKILDNTDFLYQFGNTLEKLKTTVDVKLNELLADYPNEAKELETLSNELIALGVTGDNVYLFIQGHTIKDNVVLMFLHPVINCLCSEKFKEIKTKYFTETERQNERNYYQNQLVKIETVLNTNTDFKTCFLYKQIEKDVDKYIKKCVKI